MNSPKETMNKTFMKVLGNQKLLFFYNKII